MGHAGLFLPPQTPARVPSPNVHGGSGMHASLRTPSPRLCPPAARAALALGLLLFAVAPAPAAIPVTPETRARIIGQPVALLVQPDNIRLVGPRSTVQPVITGRYSDGSLRDLTHFCEVSLE